MTCCLYYLLSLYYRTTNWAMRTFRLAVCCAGGMDRLVSYWLMSSLCNGLCFCFSANCTFPTFCTNLSASCIFCGSPCRKLVNTYIISINFFYWKFLRIPVKPCSPYFKIWCLVAKIQSQIRTYWFKIIWFIYIIDVKLLRISIPTWIHLNICTWARCSIVLDIHSTIIICTYQFITIIALPYKFPNLLFGTIQCCSIYISIWVCKIFVSSIILYSCIKICTNILFLTDIKICTFGIYRTRAIPNCKISAEISFTKWLRWNFIAIPTIRCNNSLNRI